MTDQTVAAVVGILVAAVVGSLLLWWGSACERGTFKRNPILGLRTVTTLRSDQAWIIAHRAGSPLITTAGWGVLAAVLIAVVLTVFPGPVPAVPLTLTLPIIWALGWIIASGIIALRATRDLRRDVTSTGNR
jgi:hypothetical protein